jgi:uncharacterized protein
VSASFIDPEGGFPVIDCVVAGMLPLQCQRCLDRLEWPVDLQFRLTVVGTEADLEHVADRFDAVVAGEEGFCLADSVIDELLVALPLSPRHADRTCVAAGRVAMAPAETGGMSDTNRPFAQLGALMGQAAGTEEDDNG